MADIYKIQWAAVTDMTGHVQMSQTEPITAIYSFGAWHHCNSRLTYLPTIHLSAWFQAKMVPIPHKNHQILHFLWEPGLYTMLIHFGEASSIFKHKCPKSSTFYTNFKQKTICRLVGMNLFASDTVGQYRVCGDSKTVSLICSTPDDTSEGSPHMMFIILYRTLAKEGPWAVHFTLGQDWGVGRYSRYQ